MNIELTPNEARVLGVLLEKAATTPDQYPLSLNAVMTGCNQKSNRDPVLQLDQTETVAALDGLVSKHLIRERSDAGSRVSKYAHRLTGSLGLTYDFAEDELAVLCVLMLRGPQTVGEVRVRTARLWQFHGLDEVQRVLDRLAEHKDGPYAQRLAREPGRKEARYAHLLCGTAGFDAVLEAADDESAPVPEAQTQPEPIAGEESRITRLEADVAELKRALADLKAQLGAC